MKVREGEKSYYLVHRLDVLFLFMARPTGEPDISFISLPPCPSFSTFFLTFTYRLKMKVQKGEEGTSMQLVIEKKM